MISQQIFQHIIGEVRLLIGGFQTPILDKVDNLMLPIKVQISKQSNRIDDCSFFWLLILIFISTILIFHKIIWIQQILDIAIVWHHLQNFGNPTLPSLMLVQEDFLNFEKFFFCFVLYR